MLIPVLTQAPEMFNLNQPRFLAVVAVLGSDRLRRFKSGAFQSATAVHSLSARWIRKRMVVGSQCASNVAKLKVKE
jgi:hypothetical protein